MALDLAILGKDGSPTAQVSISLVTHDWLITGAESLNLPLISRLSEYYEDTEFSHSELPKLKKEFEKISREKSPKANASETISAIINLVDEAILKNKDLRVIAD